MRNALRTFIVGLMVVALTLNPAIACHFCGGGYGWYAPAYYGGYGCGGYGCGGCGGYGYDAYGGYDCGGCGGGEVIVSDGCGCHSGGEVIVDEGRVVDGGVEAMPREAAPRPPAERPVPAQPRPTVPPQQPATVERPAEGVTPPSLPPPEPEATTPPPAEDLFDGSGAVTPPAETPPAEPADDLFGEPPAESTPADTAPTIEPAAPAETPATPPAEDDLFGGESADTGPATTEPAAPAETPGAPAEDENAEDADDLFGSSRGILREAGGLASNELRVWVDNTGKYSVNARLVRFVEGHVQLMKDTGRTTTVPLSRLSAHDLQFVNRQASAQKATAFQTAQASAPSIGMAN